jgi:adenylate cyclase
MLAVLPILGRILNNQLIDEVDDRVIDAQKSFQLELDDDLADLRLASDAMSSDPDMHRALRNGDRQAALDLAGMFSRVYPEMQILIFDVAGKLLTYSGSNVAKETSADIRDLNPTGKPFHGILPAGCTRGAAWSTLARVLAAPASDAGWVVVCQPLDAGYLSNTAAKLGLELALLDGADADRTISLTKEFPAGVERTASTVSTLVESRGRSWAIARFDPRAFPEGSRRLSVVTALDVTDIRTLVRRNLLMALAALAVAAVLSVAIGARLALMMSRAIGRVADALKKLEQNSYVHVDPVRTGDELEDLAAGFNTMVDGLQERDKLRTTFGKYMTEAVVEHLLKGQVKLGGELLPVTILFTDIRSFTTISEKMDAQSLVTLLNEYFSEMVSVVMQHNGVVDKYIGDAIMAVFGAPVPRPNDALNAVRTAVRMRTALARLNDRLAERGIAPIRTGIGVHTGEVVAGNIGSEQRMEYTVIGDAVNVASRLESSTKDLGVNVLISDATYELVKDIVNARMVDRITVKGRREPITTYEVLGLSEAATRDAAVVDGQTKPISTTTR